MEDVSNGLNLIYLIDAIRPGVVDWSKVNKGTKRRPYSLALAYLLRAPL